MSEEKTIREWLGTLPAGHRERALANLTSEWADRPLPSLALAIDSAFLWDDTTEGCDFWYHVHMWANAPEHHYLPALPEPPKPDPLRKLLAEAVELIEARHSRVSDGRVCDDIPTPELAFLIKARRALQR